MEGTFTDWKTICVVILEGTILAPAIYVADVPRMPGIEISQFADDTAASTSITQSKASRYIYLILNHGYTNGI
jgi:hypothetical protein